MGFVIRIFPDTVARCTPVRQHGDGRARYWMVRNGMQGVGADEMSALQEDGRPFAIIQGRTDPCVRSDYLAGLLYRNISTGTPVFIDAGHAVYWHAPTVFNVKMRHFLRYVS